MAQQKVACINCAGHYEVTDNGAGVHWRHLEIRERELNTANEGVCPHCLNRLTSGQAHIEERKSLAVKLRTRGLNSEIVWGESPNGRGVIFA